MIIKVVIVLNATDFEYDGIHARDFGLIICNIDSGGGVETTPVGAEINFNMVSSQHGSIQYITDTTYDSVLEATFHVCKFSCETDLEYLTIEEQREITRWLNRDEVHLLRFISDDPTYDHVCYEGTFNINKIEVNGQVIGLELHFISNRPFALGNKKYFIINATTADYEYEFRDDSDKIGYIYPDVLTVTLDSSVESNSTLTIHNSAENRTTRVKNCTGGETITFTGCSNISSDLNIEGYTAHKVQNDFNYMYFRVANSYSNRMNKITISVPCVMKFEYYPIVKGVGL